MNSNSLLFFLFLVGGLYPGVNAQSVTYEAEKGTLLNGADKQTCTACSAGYQVGYLGGNLNGTGVVTLNNVVGGNYVLSLAYSTADQRTLFVTVNNESPMEVNCKSSGGWQTLASQDIAVDLAEGMNTIRFDNTTGWGPNLDAFTLTPGKRYTVSGVITFENTPLANAVVNITGGCNRTVTTNEQGYYVFHDLPADRDYSIAPQVQGKVCAPLYRPYTALKETLAIQNFRAETTCTDCIKSFTFGSDGTLAYNTQTGTATVTVKGNDVIRNAYAVVANQGKILTSMDYTHRSVSFNDIMDDFGAGKKISVWLTGNDLPQLQQTFYVYTNRNYFLTEVSIQGAAVNSNYMAPLVSNSVTLTQASGDPAVLAVPFDNDTFIRYTSKTLATPSTVTSSEVTAYYDNLSRQGLVLGSVEHQHWKTGIQIKGVKSSLSALTVWGGYTDINITRDAMVHGSLSGTTVKSPKIFVGLFDDWRHGLDEYGKANALAEPRYVFDWKGPTPVGWNSWGVIQTDLSLAKAKSVVDFFANNLRAFRIDKTAFVDLDSYWDNMVQGGLEGDFSKLTEFATYCKTNGLKPGIYWAPFVDWGKYDRRVEGGNGQYAATWTTVNGNYHELDGGRAMDPTHPATLERIKYVIGKFKRCGFEMIKIDFLGHAAIEADHFYDATVTTGMQAYRKGMEYLINALEGKMLVYAAISPSLATGRYAHVRRIACDAFADINATEYTLNSTTYGWWQTHCYNYIDADHVVFNQQSAGENRARFTSAVINGTIITGDDFSRSGPWTSQAMDLLQRREILAIVANGKAFRPVNGGTDGASTLFEKQVGEDYYLAVLNYATQQSVDIKLSRLALDGSDYDVKDLLSGTHYFLQGPVLTLAAGTKDAAILKFSKNNVVTAINPDQEKDTVFFYPNPTHTQVKINSSKTIRSVRVSSVDGNTLLAFKKINRDSYLLDLSKQVAGVYIISLTDSSGTIKNYRIVKE